VDDPIHLVRALEVGCRRSERCVELDDDLLVEGLCERDGVEEEEAEEGVADDDMVAQLGGVESSKTKQGPAKFKFG
jgi:hypothetical protein